MAIRQIGHRETFATYLAKILCNISQIIEANLFGPTGTTFTVVVSPTYSLRRALLEKDYPNFKFYVALSEPLEEDNWKVKDSLDAEGDGFIGFVHQVVIDQYLNHHEEPEDIEVYFCGPPLMNMAVEKMAEDFGVPPENVRFDDFGG